jgi:hypothetical protein
MSEKELTDKDLENLGPEEMEEDPMVTGLVELLDQYGVKTDSDKGKELLCDLVGFVAEQVEAVEPETVTVERDLRWVQYIGVRVYYNHREYGSWKYGQVKQVPTSLAEKMLKHPDVFVKPEPEDIPESSEVVELEDVEEVEEDNLQDMRDKVMAFRAKQPIIDMIKTEYQVDIVKETQGVKEPKMADLQRVALMKIDQFGLNT